MEQPYSPDGRIERWPRSRDRWHDARRRKEQVVVVVVVVAAGRHRYCHRWDDREGDDEPSRRRRRRGRPGVVVLDGHRRWEQAVRMAVRSPTRAMVVDCSSTGVRPDGRGRVGAKDSSTPDGVPGDRGDGRGRRTELSVAMSLA